MKFAIGAFSVLITADRGIGDWQGNFAIIDRRRGAGEMVACETFAGFADRTAALTHAQTLAERHATSLAVTHIVS